MVIASDLLLRGTAWDTAIAACEKIFLPRTNYDVCLLSASIGVLYDKRIDHLPIDDEGNSPPSVPRNVFNNNSEPFDELFQTAILTTCTEDYQDEFRLEMAFGEGEKEFDRRAFLLSFANFGVTKLVELIADDEVETIENIKNFLTSTVEGTNLDFNPLPADDDYDIDIDTSMPS